MDWTVGPLDDWTIFFFFGTIFWTIFGPFYREGEVDHQYLRRGGMQFISTQEGVGGRLLLHEGGGRRTIGVVGSCI